MTDTFDSYREFRLWMFGVKTAAHVLAEYAGLMTDFQRETWESRRAYEAGEYHVAAAAAE